MEFATSINIDTGGEFAWGVWNRGFPFPGSLFSPRFRPNGRWGEFANSINILVTSRKVGGHRPIDSTAFW
jgi:hypothetical protein